MILKSILAATALLVTITACGSKNDLPLEGTNWKLTSMPGIPMEAIAAESDNFVINFDVAQMMVSGRTNCNRFFGRYEREGRKEIEFKNMGMTRMACPDMQFEDIFIKNLDDVDTFKIKGNVLTFFDDKVVIATFNAAPKSVVPAATLTPATPIEEAK